jgi:RND family efflux transporter MFP subunit
MSSIPQLFRLLSLLAYVFVLSGCDDPAQEASEEVVRGMKGFQVAQTASSEARRYPTVVQPAKESRLAFEVGGQLKEITLEVGQRVIEGQVLAEIDPKSLSLQVEQASAALDQAKAVSRNAASDLDRKTQLLANGFATQASFDQAQSTKRSADAQVEQASKQLDIAEESLSKSKLVAPFDGIVSSVEVDSFASVSPGLPILGLYSDALYQVSFSVPATIVNALEVGAEAFVRVADVPGSVHKGRISEIGSRAERVSAFPVVVDVASGATSFKAGMAAEVELRISLGEVGAGFLVPLNCFAMGALSQTELINPSDRSAEVFVFDPELSVVNRRVIHISGIRENMAIVNEGLKEGEIIAAAGVSYLIDGQRVRLLPMHE